MWCSCFGFVYTFSHSLLAKWSSLKISSTCALLDLSKCEADGAGGTDTAATGIETA